MRSHKQRKAVSARGRGVYRLCFEAGPNGCCELVPAGWKGLEAASLTDVMDRHEATIRNSLLHSERSSVRWIRVRCYDGVKVDLPLDHPVMRHISKLVCL